MSASPARLDVLGLGAVTQDDIVYVDAYPPADAKIAVRRTERHCGGLTGTALVAAARLGGRCAYAGTLGTDDVSSFLVSSLDKEGIDIRQVGRRPEVRPIRAFIVVDEVGGTRNVFVDLNGRSGAGRDWPPEEVLLSTRVLFVDHLGVPGMLRAAMLCRRAGISVVADFEHSPVPEFKSLLQAVDHLILSRAFAEELTGESDPESATAALFNAGRQVVAVTGGRDGCWYACREHSGRVSHHPAFRVEATDTTGCGDVFHGAYAFGLAKGMNLEDRLRLASAAAAIKAQRAGGQAGIPKYDEVMAFLQRTP